MKARAGDLGVAEVIRLARERGFGGEIIASWERCTRAGLHPSELNPPPQIDDAEYRARFERNREIVELFHFYIRRFTSTLQGLGACSFVCDASGYILARVGCGKTLAHFDRAAVHERASCAEQAMGTNAPGLALVTREPVVVTADEHYSRQFHTAFCVAAPILDDGRNLLGAVDITKFFDQNISDDLKQELLKLVISVTDAMRSEMSLRTIARSPLSARSRGEPRSPADAERPAAVIASLDASHGTFADIVALSPRLAEVIRVARSFSQKDGNVLIQGETGTGKELFARAIHNEGPRAAASFVAVNCAAIPVELAESELFGYERGAFTGARAEGQPGKFELAHQGTLFLDEVDSMPLAVQAKILRAVETKRVARINGKREIAVDVRIIAAANKNLAEEVLAGRFRKDLFYRLNVLRLATPALREVREDIPLILDAFLAAFAAELRMNVKVLSDDARAALVAYDWPGNVREVRNCIEYLYNTVEGEFVAPELLPPDLAPVLVAPRAQPVAEPTATCKSGLEAVERQFLVDTMRKVGGNAVAVARLLGISRSTIYRKLKKHGIT